jgi:signal-transduction protein with cAMP-binding, CBS, and nucleotidyltransferase domain
MSAPLVGVRAGAFAFEALLEMTRRRIHHLGVTEDGRLVGVISSYDFLLVQATHPVTLAREITRAESLGALASLAPRVTQLVRRLVEAASTTPDVSQIVAELNDRIVIRVLGRMPLGGHSAGPCEMVRVLRLRIRLAMEPEELAMEPEEVVSWLERSARSRW